MVLKILFFEITKKMERRKFMNLPTSWRKSSISIYRKWLVFNFDFNLLNICPKYISFILCYILCDMILLVQAQNFPENLKHTKRIVVVLSENWDASDAHLYCLERDTQTKWKVMMSWPVKIGRNGLGWGKSIENEYFQEILTPQKQEGDGKAPAGIFSICRRVYGYDPQPFADLQWPYTQVTTDWIGIDDPQSLYYNQLLNRTTIAKSDWNSYEELRRRDHLYRFFLVVEHNTQPYPIPNAGSCIFIHIWYNPNKASAGCTSMAEDNLLQLIQWLQLEDNPILIQWPCSIYQTYSASLNLPDLDSITQETTFCHLKQK